MLPKSGKRLRVGIGGLGAIGGTLARHLDDGIEGLSLVAIAVRHRDRDRPGLKRLKVQPEIIGLGDLAAVADVVRRACLTKSLYRQLMLGVYLYQLASGRS